MGSRRSRRLRDLRGAVTTSASQLYHFDRELQTGELVAYASSVDRHVHLGRATGPHRFIAGAPDGYCHQRSVE